MLDLPKHFAQRVALFEKECARIRRRGNGPEGVVLLGDSLARCYRGRIPWVNRGICSDHLRWPELNVFERLGSDRLHPNPQAIVTLIGINDINDAPAATTKHINAYRHLLTNLAQLYPSARLGVMSVLPTRAGASHLNRSIRQFNDELADVAAAHKAVFWNLHERFLDPKTGAARARLIRDDGVHITQRGYDEMTALVAEQAAGLGIQTASGGPDPEALRRRETQKTVLRAWELARPALGRLSKLLPDAGDERAFSAIDRMALGRKSLDAYGREAWGHKAEMDSDEKLIVTHIVPEMDFLCRYAATGAPLFLDLYLGSRAAFLAQNKPLWADCAGGVRDVLARDRALWLETLDRSEHAPRVRTRIEAVFDELRDLVVVPKPKSVRLLFVGDCLLEDVELLLGGQLLRHGILPKIEFVLSKNPLEQVRAFKAARAEKFDGVVYSPLSWEFDPEFKNFLQPTVRSRREMTSDVETIWKRVSSTMRLLADSFECPIYVHNTAAAVRASDEFRRTVKSLLTYPQRDFARKELSRRIGGLLAEINKETFQHLVLIDELSAVRDLRDDLTLGRVLYYAEAIHPAALSCEVARRLANYVVAAARFVDKKVVVCDLDNTLWDGVIGEGLGVRHQTRRQKTLRALKQKGVVLAINSKNDPANVKWEDSVLSADDFVAAEISWGPKAAAMKRIQETLNLKLKDFVFIDDRSDERSMISQEYPELTAMDPCVESTWSIFDAWASLLGNDEGDRTQLYREKAEREKLIGDQVDESAATDMFMKLQLKIDIVRSTTDDLKRIHELINRTNQWNLQGSRCTFNEVKAWHESAKHVLYTARVRDKFGDMGLICCCMVEIEESSLNVPIFVLSCRVFGYGVETLVLEQIKRDALARFGAPNVRGKYVENAHNKPCKAMYDAHGFACADGVWSHPGGATTAPDPVWFRAS